MPGKNNLDVKNRIEAECRSKLNRITEIKQTLSDIEHRLMDSDIGIVRAAEEDWQRLVAQFYEISKAMMAPQQYEAAKKDIAYFRTMINLAIATYQPQNYDIGTVR